MLALVTSLRFLQIDQGGAQPVNGFFDLVIEPAKKTAPALLSIPHGFRQQGLGEPGVAIVPIIETQQKRSHKKAKNKSHNTWDSNNCAEYECGDAEIRLK